MRKLFCSLILIVTFFIPLIPAMAIDLGKQLVGETAVKAGYESATTKTTFAETIGTVIKAALSFVGVIFLVLMVYAGYLWMTASGAEEQIEKARKIITAAIIGLIITVGAYSITNFVVPAILARTVAQ